MVSSKHNLVVVLFMVLKLLSKNRSEKAILSLLLQWKRNNMFFCVISICCQWNQCFCHLEKAEPQYRSTKNTHLTNWEISLKQACDKGENNNYKKRSSRFFEVPSVFHLEHVKNFLRYSNILKLLVAVKMKEESENDSVEWFSILHNLQILPKITEFVSHLKQTEQK